MKTPRSTNRPRTPASAIFRRRRRRCFLVRGDVPLRPPGRPPPAGRLPGGRPPGGRPPPLPPPLPPELPAPVREAVVRPRLPPADARRAGGGVPRPPLLRPVPPPPPVLRVRAGGGRRTEPDRGATGEVSSWEGTNTAPLGQSGASGPGRSRSPGWRLQLSITGTTREDTARHGTPVTEGSGVTVLFPARDVTGTTPWRPGASCAHPERVRHRGRTSSPGGSSRNCGRPRPCTRRTRPAWRPCGQIPPRSSPVRRRDRGSHRRRS